MFLKVLLLLPLAVFCQAFRSEEKYYGHTGLEIIGGLEVGKALRIVTDHAPARFKIFIKTKPGGDSGDGDIGLFLAYNRDNGKVLTNSKVNGSWGHETSFWTTSKKKVNLEIVMEQDYFDIYINGEQYYFKYQVPVETLKYWELISLSDGKFKWFRQFVPNTCKST